MPSDMKGEKDLFKNQPHKEVPSNFKMDPTGDYEIPNISTPCEHYNDGSCDALTYGWEKYACAELKTSKTGES